MILLDLGLTLFNITKDAVFAEIVVSSNIFGFLVVDWTPKWIKSANLGCVPFKPKLRILKNFSNNVFLIGDYLWSKLQQGQTIFGGVTAQKKPRWVIDD